MGGTGLNSTMTLQRLDRSNVLDLPAECVSDIALVLPDGLSYDVWRRIGERIFSIRKATQWWVGDWVLKGEVEHPQTYSQALPEYSIETIKVYTWVASRIAPGRRRVELSFSHHQEVARLGETDQDRWLKYAVANRLSSKELRKLVREERIADGIEEERPARVSLDKEAIKELSIRAMGKLWTREGHNSLMVYLNINHSIERIVRGAE